MPKYMFLIKADAGAEGSNACDDNSELYAKMTAFNEQMTAAGVMLDGEGFTPTKDGYRLKYSSKGEPQVSAGPFDVDAEAHVCGYWKVKCKDAEEALSWAKKIPFDGGELIVRQIAGMDDLPDFPDELKAREDKMRATLDARK